MRKNHTFLSALFEIPKHKGRRQHTLGASTYVPQRHTEMHWVYTKIPSSSFSCPTVKIPRFPYYTQSKASVCFPFTEAVARERNNAQTFSLEEDAPSRRRRHRGQSDVNDSVIGELSLMYLAKPMNNNTNSNEEGIFLLLCV